MSWRVVYIEDSEHLSLYLDNIKVIKDKEEMLIPISDIHTLILDNYKINLSVHLINALTKANINFILCDVDHLPQTIVLPHLGNKLAFQMLNKQLAWNSLLKSEVQQNIIKNKIRNQYKLLEYLNKDIETISKLKQYENEVELADKTNREGLSAKLYFRALYGSGFKRFSEDVINNGLNYGYAILRSQISKVLVAKGLNTSIGFFHIGRENEFNLSDDVIEPFRPIIDYFIYKHLREEKIFLREHRLNIIKCTTGNMIIDGKSQTIFNTIQLYVESILNYCDDHKEIKEVLIDFNGI